MRALDPRLDLAGFFARLRQARARVLLLDYDGTIAPFHRRPEHAHPYPRVSELLARAMLTCATRVVIVSGRRLADLRAPLARIPWHEAWACHGWQRLVAGGAPAAGFVPCDAARLRLQLAEAPARRLALLGARIERKAASVAVHWRGVAEPSVERIREHLHRAWRGHGEELELIEFDGGMELRARGRDKGSVVRGILDECSPDTVCAYLGDDTTDEDAFAAIRGRGLGILVRPQLRETRADAWLAPPAELLAFLERWCASATAS